MLLLYRPDFRGLYARSCIVIARLLVRGYLDASIYGIGEAKYLRRLQYICIGRKMCGVIYSYIAKYLPTYTYVRSKITHSVVANIDM